MAYTRQLVSLTKCALVLITIASSVMARESKSKAVRVATSSTSPTIYGARASNRDIHFSIIDRLATAPSSLPAATSIRVAPAKAPANGDLLTAAGGHHHGYDYGKYYEYREVPEPNTWKFGYRRGNHKHTIERHEHALSGKYPHFKTEVKWYDAESHGKGHHVWDYNHHDDHKHYHHHY